MPIYVTNDEDKLIYLYRPDATGLEPPKKSRGDLAVGLSSLIALLVLVLL